MITDPPFGDNIFYSDLSNFFYAWLRLPLSGQNLSLICSARRKNAECSQEALTPRADSGGKGQRPLSIAADRMLD